MKTKYLRYFYPSLQVILKDFYCEAICDSLSHHLISDVEVGIFLSAGIDSTTLVSLASENSVGVKGLKTVNIGFNEFHNTIIDETIEAEKISRYYKAQHFSKIVSKHEFISEYDALINAMDQPSIDGVNTYFAAKLASQNNLKVVLSGIGADEILSGYKHFKSMPRLISIIKPFKSLPILGKVFRDFNNLFLRNLVSPKFASLVEFHGDFPSSYLLRRSLFLPWEINNILGQDFTKKGLDDLNTLKELESTVCGIKNEQSIISCLELSWYMRNQLLRDTDWASMAHSLEVRTPFVDPIFFRKILKIVQSGINLDKPSFARFLPNSLPSSVLSRRKTGFNVPVKDWIKDSEQNNGLSNKYGLRKWAYQIKNEFKC